MWSQQPTTGSSNASTVSSETYRHCRSRQVVARCLAPRDMFRRCRNHRSPSDRARNQAVANLRSERCTAASGGVQQCRNARGIEPDHDGCLTDSAIGSSRRHQGGSGRSDQGPRLAFGWCRVRSQAATPIAATSAATFVRPSSGHRKPTRSARS